MVYAVEKKADAFFQKVTTNRLLTIFCASVFVFITAGALMVMSTAMTRREERSAHSIILSVCRIQHTL